MISTKDKNENSPLKKLVIGVLSLQGCVKPHFPHIEALGATPIEVKTLEDFNLADAFILPGGESTTMWKIIDNFELQPIMEEHFSRKPVWGICAGAILMARKVLGRDQRSLNLGPFDVERNGHGRQIDSHEIIVNGYPVTLIRAPKIKNIHSEEVEILAGGVEEPSWILFNKKYMATTFHPELTDHYPSPMHQLFFSIIKREVADSKTAICGDLI